ncbi:hypothetical protein BV22DRAFT_1041437 [Leucogyrophana mollusca]|uniref:Uncharacterized protein n=1 Tax=Leucogyrophana mollusca TaxID=85980 RepID=A0ACB8B027_9AGAM|nr:hypothetical protein BV22DRAFT_1041437 [Leucogyrophana mollusca]
MAVLSKCGTSNPIRYHSKVRKDLDVGLAPEEADRGAGPRDNVQEGNPANAKEASSTESVPGSRVLWSIVFRKLRPITELSAKELLRTWWEVVLCHYELWKGGIHHRDISESNLVYYRNAQDVAVGVLNDFDLTSTTEGRQGNKRTGTMPFMAIELLDQEGPEDHITHQYRHDAESFVWILAWLTLHYANGTRLPRKHRPLKTWLSLQAVECGDKKAMFIMRQQHKIVPLPSQTENWRVVRRGLEVVGIHYLLFRHAPVVVTMEEVFEKWLYNLVKGILS